MRLLLLLLLPPLPPLLLLRLTALQSAPAPSTMMQLVL
jgi:hypothetical protein